LRSKTALFLIFCLVFAAPALSKIYTFIDSKGRLTYTSDPSILPEGHEHRAAPDVGKDQSESAGDPSSDSGPERSEELSRQVELTETEIDQKLNSLSEVSAEEYDQTVYDIQGLKIQMLELNEELIYLTAINQEETELRLAQLYKWAEDLDVQLENYEQINETHVENTRQEDPSNNEDKIEFGSYSFASGNKVNVKPENSASSSLNSW